MFKRQIFGLDISDHSIEALLLEKPFLGKVKAVSYARAILHGEVVKNGIIKKPEKLAQAIVKLLASAKPGPITAQHCVLSLPESQVFSTIFKLPAGLRPGEIKNTIPYKAEEAIPFNPAEIYYDFKKINQYAETQEIFYVAVPIKVVDSYVQVLASVGLKPLAFDLESVSLVRALISLPIKSDKAKLVMDIGARTTNLNIFDRNGIRQNLTIKVAGDHFTKAIAKSLNITSKAADELKIKNGFDPKNEQGKILLVLQKEFKRIIAEAKRLIDFYQTENSRQIDQVILVGGSALLPQLDQYLADNLGIETIVGEPLTKIDDPQNLLVLKKKAILFANVIGLAWRGLNKNPVTGDINLLPIVAKKITLAPPKWQKKAWLMIYFRLAVFVALILVLGLILVLRQSNWDLYGKIFPSPKYQTDMTGVDPAQLDQLRQNLLTPPTSTLPLIQIKDNSVGYLNVRERPGQDYKIIGQAPNGQKYSLLGEQNNWYQIQLNEKTSGWVNSLYVDKLP